MTAIIRSIVNFNNNKRLNVSFKLRFVFCELSKDLDSTLQESSQTNQTISKSLNIDNLNKLDTNRDSLAFSSIDFQNQTNEMVQQTLNTIQSPKRNNLNEKSTIKSAKSAKTEQVQKLKKPYKKSVTKTAELEPALTVNKKHILYV